MTAIEGPEVVNYERLKRQMKSMNYPQLKTVIVMYGGIQQFWEGGKNLKKRTMASLLQFHNQTVSKIVSSFGGFVSQFRGEHFLAYWNLYDNIENFDKLAARAAVNLVQIAHDYLHLHFKSFGYKDFHFSLGLMKEKVNINCIEIKGEKHPIFDNHIVDTTKQLFDLAPNCTAFFHEKLINELVKNDLPPMRKLFNLKLTGEAQGARIFSFKA